MNNWFWYVWPWASLVTFATLVRTFGPTRLFLGSPLLGQTEVDQGGSRIGTLLALSLIVGAAICVLIDAAF